MATITAQPSPGPIEQSLTGLSTERAVQRRVLAHIAKFAALSAADRAGFTAADGTTVTLLTRPQLIHDHAGNVIGYKVQAISHDASGAPHPRDDGWHIVINPPYHVPDGTVHLETDPLTGAQIQVANLSEDPIAVLHQWLTASVLHQARANGWTG